MCVCVCVSLPLLVTSHIKRVFTVLIPALIVSVKLLSSAASQRTVSNPA